jgi:methylated-DNA-[protein]-cysteine S-methyltransferase
MITAYLNEYTSPLGTMILASNGTGLCGAWFEGQAHFEENLPLRLGAPHASLDELHLAQGSEAHYDRIISCVRTWLDLYFTGEDPGALPPLDLHGTNFQEEVWTQLARIPYGSCTSYGKLAQQIQERRNDNRRVSARAVGSAVARNPVSVIVPCHRVIGADGSLTGYAGGMDRKRWLLNLERTTTEI